MRNVVKVVLFSMLEFLFTVTLGTATAAGLPAIDKALVKHFKVATTLAYEYALVDLDEDGHLDAVVLIKDRDYCGSGGCTMSILHGSDESFAYVSGSTISREPIRVLRESRKGWKTLSVSVSGGGATPGETFMRFDGRRYPLNPSTQPYATAADLVGATQLRFGK